MTKRREKKDFTVSRELPFSYYSEILANEGDKYEVLAIDHIMISSLNSTDVTDMQTREDSLFLFRVKTCTT